MSDINDPKNKAILEQFFTEFAPAINMHVKKLRNEHGDAIKDIDDGDFHLAGFHGLMEAIDKYDPSRGTSFKTYAHSKINGRMRDHIADRGAIPRHIIAQAKRLKNLNPQGSSGQGSDQ